MLRDEIWCTGRLAFFRSLRPIKYFVSNPRLTNALFILNTFIHYKNVLKEIWFQYVNGTVNFFIKKKVRKNTTDYIPRKKHRCHIQILPRQFYRMFLNTNIRVFRRKCIVFCWFFRRQKYDG